VVVHGPSLGRRSAKNLQAFRVGGDSMEPLIGQGGLVLADLSQNDFQRLREGGIYVLCWDLEVGECAVKRLKWAEKGHILAIESENPDYGTLYRPLSEASLIGQVIWSWRRHNQAAL
jgi:phage repressor protein C with HTH and peptisase S24 domain